MEFGLSYQENLSLAGDSAHIPDKCFNDLVLNACRGVLLDSERNTIAGTSSSSSSSLKNFL